MLSRLVRCLLLMIIISSPALAQSPTNNIAFKSSQGHMVSVYKGSIIVNSKRSYQLGSDNVVYKSRRNRIIEDKGNVFLFLEVTDGAKKNKFYIFSIHNSIADSLFTAIASDVKDLDQDGFMEFGGSEASQPYPAADSMYYVPSRFYEIKNGQITFDGAYTEKVDTKVNKTYIPDPLDKNGNCCVVIPRKAKAK
ncbi:MAG TPA: hypothetical protein VGD35_08290 [Chitinophaga sp.]